MIHIYIFLFRKATPNIDSFKLLLTYLEKIDGQRILVTVAACGGSCAPCSYILILGQHKIFSFSSEHN